MSFAAAATAGELGDIPKRKLGKTGLEVTIMSLGGARIGNLPDEKPALDVVRRCYDIGVNYFDTAAAGAYGLSQVRYGKALADVNKNIIFGTKTRHRTWAHAELDLNQSLANLKRDWIDLYQVHNVMHQADIDAVFARDGLMEMIEKAKRDGKIRFVGFTGHMDPRVHAKMLEMYDWDTVLMPLSVSDGAHDGFSFEQTVLKPAVDKGVGVIAMKTTGVGALPGEGVSSLDECLSYVWSLPISTAILGCTTKEQVDADARIAVATAKKRLSEAQRKTIRSKWAKADFKRLESWKVDQTSKTLATNPAEKPRYLGD
ncbi:MAG: aldo/keto reductase [Acidobacteria bacterium]|nr:aldo/keto reductase [Acidobacteriota bacterium]